MTQIAVIVDDKMIIVDGVAIHCPRLDMTRLRDLGAAYDDVHAVQFDTKRGQGHIEYCDVVTDEAARPNIKPGNWQIDATTFENKFGWILPLYQKQAAADAAKAQADALNVQATAALVPILSGGHDPAIQDAMLAELMALKAANETMQKQIAAHTQTFQALGDIDLAKP